MAKLLGYKTHAEYILELRMAKTPETVSTFLAGLAEKLRALQADELEGFLKYKAEDVSPASTLQFKCGYVEGKLKLF